MGCRQLGLPSVRAERLRGVKDCHLTYLANWEPESVQGSPVAATQEGCGVGEQL